MNSTRFTRLLPVVALCTGISVGFPQIAGAGLIKLEYTGANDCSGNLGTDPNCSFNQSPQILKYDTEGENEDQKLSINTSEFPTIDGSEFEFSLDEQEWVGLSSLNDDAWGTGFWRYTPGPEDPLKPVRYWSAKAGNAYNVFFIVATSELSSGGACAGDKFSQACRDAALNVTTGSWVSPTGGSLSHILFLNTNGSDGGDPPVGQVPEPATLGLLGLGMLAMGAIRRRKVALKR